MLLTFSQDTNEYLDAPSKIGGRWGALIESGEDFMISTEIYGQFIKVNSNDLHEDEWDDELFYKDTMINQIKSTACMTKTSTTHLCEF